MQKQIFNQTEPTAIESTDAQTAYRAKQEFHPNENQLLEVEPDELTEAPSGAAQEGEWLDAEFERLAKPRNGFWKTWLKLTALFLLPTALLAQTLQWLWDSYQTHRWISLALALVALSVVLFALNEIFLEHRRLKQLRRRWRLQQQSRRLNANPIAEKKERDAITPIDTVAPIDKRAVENAREFPLVAAPQTAEDAEAFCLNAVRIMGLHECHSAVVAWRRQLNPAYNAQEVAYLFSRQVLSPLDHKAKKWVSHMAAEAAIIVAVSPLAVVDTLFIAWRNIYLINKIAALYGIELGYLTRLRLLKIVIFNTAFAGATELIQDLGMDWFSQDLSAKFSARLAQGLGVGLLTARLGLKAIEFCRPLDFSPDEKPRLRDLRKVLIQTVKETVLKREKGRKKERVAETKA